MHDPRDVPLGEDAGQQRTGQMPQALAAQRHGVLNLVRRSGWASIADALRHCGANTHCTYGLLGTLPARL